MNKVILALIIIFLAVNIAYGSQKSNCVTPVPKKIYQTEINGVKYFKVGVELLTVVWCNGDDPRETKTTYYNVYESLNEARSYVQFYYKADLQYYNDCIKKEAEKQRDKIFKSKIKSAKWIIVK